MLDFYLVEKQNIKPSYNIVKVCYKDNAKERLKKISKKIEEFNITFAKEIPFCNLYKSSKYIDKQKIKKLDKKLLVSIEEVVSNKKIKQELDRLKREHKNENCKYLVKRKVHPKRVNYSQRDYLNTTTIEVRCKD